MEKTGGFLGNGGAIARKNLFWLALLAVVIYAGYKILPPVLAAYMIKTDVENEAKVAHMYSDEQLALRIMEKARAWNIPLDREQVEISRGIDFIAIEVRYTEIIRFPGGYKKEYPVYIAVNKPLRDASKLLQ